VPPRLRIGSRAESRRRAFGTEQGMHWAASAITWAAGSEPPMQLQTRQSRRPARRALPRSTCDEAIQFPFFKVLDCFVEPVIGRRFAPTRWLAMTTHGQSTVILLANIAPVIGILAVHEGLFVELLGAGGAVIRPLDRQRAGGRRADQTDRGPASTARSRRKKVGSKISRASDLVLNGVLNGSVKCSNQGAFPCVSR